MIRAIVFDFDGLILETERPQYEAWRQVYASYHRPLPEQAWLDVMGKPVRIDLFPRRLAAELQRDLDLDAVIAQYRLVVARRLAEQPTQPGVREIIRGARAMDMPLAVASGSTRRWVDGHLERLGLLEHFQCTVCCEDTDSHKPDPAPYLHACELLGVEPAQSLALEDTALGVTAAKAAGMLAVAVPTGMTADQNFDHADLRLATLADLPLSEILDKAGKQETQENRK